MASREKCHFATPVPRNDANSGLEKCPCPPKRDICPVRGFRPLHQDDPPQPVQAPRELPLKLQALAAPP